MGEIADYYIDRQLHRHMNPERELHKLKEQRQALMEGLSDQELLFAAEEAIRVNFINEKFLEITKKILSKRQLPLSERQRNSIYGLLSNHIELYLDQVRKEKLAKQEKMERLSDQELIKAVEEAISKKKVNEKFLVIASKIVASKYSRLSEKQRNCFYGLLAN